MISIDRLESPNKNVQIADASSALREEALQFPIEQAGYHRKASSGNGWEEHGPGTVMLAPGQSWDNSKRENNLRYRCPYSEDVRTDTSYPPNTTTCLPRGNGSGSNFHPGLGVFEMMLI